MNHKFEFSNFQIYFVAPTRTTKRFRLREHDRPTDNQHHLNLTRVAPTTNNQSSISSITASIIIATNGMMMMNDRLCDCINEWMAGSLNWVLTVVPGSHLCFGVRYCHHHDVPPSLASSYYFDFMVMLKLNVRKTYIYMQITKYSAVTRPSLNETHVFLRWNWELLRSCISSVIQSYSHT